MPVGDGFRRISIEQEGIVTTFYQLRSLSYPAPEVTIYIPTAHSPGMLRRS